MKRERKSKKKTPSPPPHQDEFVLWLHFGAKCGLTMVTFFAHKFRYLLVLHREMSRCTGALRSMKKKINRNEKNIHTHTPSNILKKQKPDKSTKKCSALPIRNYICWIKMLNGIKRGKKKETHRKTIKKTNATKAWRWRVINWAVLKTKTLADQSHWNLKLVLETLVYGFVL